MKTALAVARAAVEAVVIVLFLAEIVAVCALVSRCSGARHEQWTATRGLENY